MDHIDERMIRFAAERLQQGVRERADRLRKLADELDRRAKEIGMVGPGYLGAELSNSYGYQASQVVHAVMNALPNLSLDGIVSNAADLDRAVAEAKLRDARGEAVEP